jgi:hypothetical protein
VLQKEYELARKKSELEDFEAKQLAKLQAGGKKK